MGMVSMLWSAVDMFCFNLFMVFELSFEVVASSYNIENCLRYKIVVLCTNYSAISAVQVQPRIT